VIVLLAFAAGVFLCSAEVDSKKKHHHHHKHHRHHRHHDKQNSTAVANASAAKAVSLHSQSEAPASNAANSSEKMIISKMKELEQDLTSKRPLEDLALQQVQLKVNAPLPADFAMLFTQGIATATGCRQNEVKVLSSTILLGGKVDEVTFEAPGFAARDARKQAADPDSKLARGPLRLFLLAKDDGDDDGKEKEEKAEKGEEEKEEKDEKEEAVATAAAPAPAPPQSGEINTQASSGIDVDTEMPFGDLEPFGREDTAQELTESAIEESNRMVDQLERAEVAEEKRAVFRALTRLRGAAITSFDGVARSQTGNIDEYNKLNKWRKAHPLHHLAEDESDISKWAFPDADF